KFIENRHSRQIWRVKLQIITKNMVISRLLWKTMISVCIVGKFRFLIC
ncbi:conserved hypothetical protein, partial [Listeria marthii FSL S4-120]